MRISYYNSEGQKINSPIEPAYMFRNNAKNDRPEDFVAIKQLEINEMVTDPYGVQSEITRLSDPVEEVYHRWIWDSGWYCVITMIIKKNEIILDRRPNFWKFFEEFNQNRPRLI